MSEQILLTCALTSTMSAFIFDISPRTDQPTIIPVMAAIMTASIILLRLSSTFPLSLAKRKKGMQSIVLSHIFPAITDNIISGILHHPPYPFFILFFSSLNTFESGFGVSDFLVVTSFGLLFP